MDIESEVRVEETSEVAPSAHVERSTAEDLYLEHAFLLRRIAVRKFAIPDDEAEALVHDVFVEYLVRPRGVHNVRNYLIAAVCNASRNYWRAKQTRERHFPSHSDGMPAEIPGRVEADVLEGLSLRMTIGATLARLGTRCREVLRRYYLEEENAASIAAALDTTPSNVNYLMHICRKKARAIYDTIGRPR
ncbi:MAG TPA: sigma-70 family RNA polymerase sigma factor [Thermoanaerobaculia bacterium]|nr:sigma-70 family RNA polymerase sigma factor [Thermoanaerobaculia bacterium]